MKNTITISLFVIATGLLFSCGKPVQESVQLNYIHQMLGMRPWSGIEKDSFPSAYPYTAPAYDTSYNVSLNITIMNENDTTLNLYINNGGYNNFQQGYFYYLALDTAAKKMLFYYTDTCCNIYRKDTLTYNYLNHTMALTQYYSNPGETYIMNMYTP